MKIDSAKIAGVIRELNELSNLEFKNRNEVMAIMTRCNYLSLKVKDLVDASMPTDDEQEIMQEVLALCERLYGKGTLTWIDDKGFFSYNTEHPDPDVWRPRFYVVRSDLWAARDELIERLAKAGK